MSGKNRVESVERALAILGAFLGDQERLSLKDLADRTGLYKSTILRLTSSLEAYDYLIRDEEGRWRLGPVLWRLGAAYRKTFDLGATVLPTLRMVRDRLGESVAFYIRDGDRRVCLHRVVGSKGLVHEVQEGVPLPLDRGAAGHVLMAWEDETGEQYERIRQQGFCVSLGERDPDIAAVATPVLSSTGTLKGALSLSGLKGRFNDGFIAEVVAVLKPQALTLGKSMP
ncbi:MAG: IclR family transcriptional regulator [Rhodospirillaceae bacterium]